MNSDILSKKFIDFFNSNYFLIPLSLLILSWYLSPIFFGSFYVDRYDNLDSTIVWYKILTSSGKIFADNSSIIPNMMHGLPRLSYGSEIDPYLWIYTLLGPEKMLKSVFLLSHIIAFFSMYLFLKRYCTLKTAYRSIIVVSSSLLFSMLPFWPWSSFSVVLLPLYIYVMLNIYFKRDTIYDWILLILMPIFGSFIMTMLFFLIALWIVIFVVTIKQHRVHGRLLLAALLISFISLSTQYRLIEGVLLSHYFQSHRLEFNFFFSHNLVDSYKMATNFFKYGSTDYLNTLAYPWLIPAVFIAMILEIVKFRFDSLQTFLFLGCIACIYYLLLWDKILPTYDLLPIFFILGVIGLKYSISFFERAFYSSILAWVLLSIYFGLCYYQGFAPIMKIFPLLRELNISRFAYLVLLPLYGCIVPVMIWIFSKYLKMFPLIVILFLGVQASESFHQRNFSDEKRYRYFTFDEYYAPKLYDEIKKYIKKRGSDRTVRFLHYGIEPAPALFNGLYTVGGYCTNYPLSYKHRFGELNRPCIERFPSSKKVFDDWGSKLYLSCLDTRPERYLSSHTMRAESETLPLRKKALCDLDTDYILSRVPLKNRPHHSLIQFLKRFESHETRLKIYLYKVKCSKLSKEKNEN